MADVPLAVRKSLAMGEIETVNLMEWLVADMATLARTISAQCSTKRLGDALTDAAIGMSGAGVTGRLKIAGAAIAKAVTSFDSAEFVALANHRSDLVRQWACYAANDASLGLSLKDHLQATQPFAADRNMSVREAAWMAYRPHLATDLDRGLALLEPVTKSEDPNLRRFAIEVTRPRSVWGMHIERMKRCPEIALELLENVKRDSSRYVQLALGNWLNDASKSRPDWVLNICNEWLILDDPCTSKIVARGLRTIRRNPYHEEGSGIGRRVLTAGPSSWTEGGSDD